MRGWIRAAAAVQLVIGSSGLHAMEMQEGLQLFTTHCANCHGADGRGGQMAPRVLPRVASTDNTTLAEFLREGVPAKGMPPAAIPATQLPALMGYLRLLARSGGNAGNTVKIDAENRYASMPHITRFTPVTDAMLLDPSPNDWLWFSRTPDAQRFSPLDQINRGNIGQLALAWSKGLPEGITETIPTVYDGVMYVTLPGGNVAALDTTTGAIVVDGKVVSSGTCGGASKREHCNITAHDARTGKLAWQFQLTQAADDPVPGIVGKRDTWAGLPLDKRKASSWGLPGSYDAATNTLYWTVANPTPYTRLARHGNADAIPPRPRPISTAIPRWRWIRPPASSSGTTSICRAMTGMTT